MPLVQTPKAMRARPQIAAGTLAQRGARPPFAVCALKNLLWLSLSLIMIVWAVEGVFALAHAGEQEYMKIDPFLGFLLGTGPRGAEHHDGGVNFMLAENHLGL